MNRQAVKYQLQSISLNLDTTTIYEAEKFLLQDVGFISDLNLNHQIFAAVAIISESKALPNYNHTGLLTNGIHIENVMSHIGDLSKEQFLETLKKLLDKIQHAPQNLKKKIQDVFFSYRFYKKYQSTFDILYDQVGLAPHSKSQFSALFWVLYLYVKDSFIQNKSIKDAKDLLIFLFRSVFEKYLSNLCFNDIRHVMDKTIGYIPEICQTKCSNFQKQFDIRLDHFYSQRFSQNKINFEKIQNNHTYLVRLLDDISNSFANQRYNLTHYSQINQLSYLNLQKNLTPQSFRKQQPFLAVQPISKTLNFDSDDDNNEDNDTDSPDPVSPLRIELTQNEYMPIQAEKPETPVFRKVQSLNQILFKSSPIQFCLQTPISIKIENENWAKYRIERLQQQKVENLKIFYENTTSKSFFSLKELIMMKISQSIQSSSIKCININQTKQQTFKFFLINLIQILDISQQNNSSWVKDDQSFRSIACLSAQLFNYTQNSYTAYKNYCQIFEISIKNRLKPIELCLKHLTKVINTDIRQYLIDVRSRFIIYDLWKNQQGFKIITQVYKNSTQSNSTHQFEQIQLIQSIVRQSRMRMKDICNKTKMKTNMMNKTVSILESILKEKPYLLKHNNLDQIILCCIMSSLSMNQKQNKLCLNQLFILYNDKVPFSFNQNQNRLQDQYGNQMNIVDYYNQVFLREISDLFDQNYDQNHQCIITPQRIHLELPNFSKNIGLPSFKSLTKSQTKIDSRKQYLRKLHASSEMSNEKDQKPSKKNKIDETEELFCPMSLFKAYSFQDLSKK